MLKVRILEKINTLMMLLFYLCGSAVIDIDVSNLLP